MDIKRALEILQLEPGFTPDALEKAKKTLIAAVHPDKHPHDKKKIFEHLTRDAIEAYELIKKSCPAEHGGARNVRSKKPNPATSKSKCEHSYSKMVKDLDDISKVVYETNITKNTSSISEVRSAVTNWAASFSNHTVVNLGDTIDILSLRKIFVHRITLKTSVLERTVGASKNPYRGEPIPPRTMDNIKEIDPWDFPVNIFDNPFLEKELEEASGWIEIDGSQSVMTCPRCKGDGGVTCNNCNGEGSICEDVLRLLDRMGETVCRACRGKGGVTCSECNGRGEVISYFYRQSTYSCEKSHGYLFPSQLPEKVRESIKESPYTNIAPVLRKTSDFFFSKGALPGSKDITGLADKVLGNRQSWHGKYSGNKLLLAEQIEVCPIELIQLDYKFRSKEYALWIYKGVVCSVKNPILDMADEKLREAEVLSNSGKLSAAYESARKAADIFPANNSIKELKDKLSMGKCRYSMHEASFLLAVPAWGLPFIFPGRPNIIILLIIFTALVMGYFKLRCRSEMMETEKAGGTPLRDTHTFEFKPFFSFCGTEAVKMYFLTMFVSWMVFILFKFIFGFGMAAYLAMAFPPVLALLGLSFVYIIYRKGAKSSYSTEKAEVGMFVFLAILAYFCPTPFLGAGSFNRNETMEISRDLNETPLPKIIKKWIIPEHLAKTVASENAKIAAKKETDKILMEKGEKDKADALDKLSSYKYEIDKIIANENFSEIREIPGQDMADSMKILPREKQELYELYRTKHNSILELNSLTESYKIKVDEINNSILEFKKMAESGTADIYSLRNVTFKFSQIHTFRMERAFFKIIYPKGSRSGYEGVSDELLEGRRAEYEKIPAEVLAGYERISGELLAKFNRHLARYPFLMTEKKLNEFYENSRIKTAIDKLQDEAQKMKDTIDELFSTGKIRENRGTINNIRGRSKERSMDLWREERALWQDTFKYVEDRINKSDSDISGKIQKCLNKNDLQEASKLADNIFDNKLYVDFQTTISRKRNERTESTLPRKAVTSSPNNMPKRTAGRLAENNAETGFKQGGNKWVNQNSLKHADWQP